MIFNIKKHNSNLYNTLLKLSRNIFFYKDIELEDTYETRIYLMFIHYSTMLYISKNKRQKPDQDNYNSLFLNIENNLRELGFGDVSVNKKMKELNKILYDILLKIDLNKNDNKGFKLNKDLLNKYFTSISTLESSKLAKFNDYFSNFFNFCFELHLDNMLEETIKFKF